MLVHEPVTQRISKVFKIVLLNHFLCEDRAAHSYRSDSMGSRFAAFHAG